LISMRPVLLLPAALLLSPGASLVGASEQAARQAYQSGRLSLQHEAYEEAEKQFRAAIGLDPLLAPAHYGLGQVLMATRRFADAVTAFEGARDAHRRGLSRALAEVAKADQQRDNEIRDLRDSIRQIETGQLKYASPQDITRLEQRIQTLEQEKSRSRTQVTLGEPPAEFSLALGSAHFRTGALPAARQAYLDALKAQPGFAEAHNNLAAVALQMGDLPEARLHLKEAERGGFPVNRKMKAEIEGRALAEAEAEPAPAPLVIRHEPLRCAAAGAFPVLEARVESPGRVARVKAKFRRPDSEFWYTVAMKAEGDGRFVATLPKPKPGLGAFRYVIDAVDQAAATSRTEELEVAVSDDPKGCPAPAVAAARSVVVEVPAGAPARPPVPNGFSASGVKGEGGSRVGIFYMPPRLAAAVGVSVVAGGAAAAAVALYDDPPSNPPPSPPELVVVRSQPPVGGTLSLSRDRLTLSLRVTLRRAIGSGTLSLSLTRSTGNCFLTFQSVHEPIPAETPFELTFGGAPTTQSCSGGGGIDVGFLTIGDNFDRNGQSTFFQFPISYAVAP
jgi:TolA-binding protein